MRGDVGAAGRAAKWWSRRAPVVGRGEGREEREGGRKATERPTSGDGPDETPLTIRKANVPR